MEANNIKSIKIKARRWFQRSYGNTYHRVLVTVTTDDGVKQYESDIHYGYGEHYDTTALETLEKEIGIKVDRYPNGERKTGYLSTWARAHEIACDSDVNDVSTERELKGRW
jgi:hypothetical protein